MSWKDPAARTDEKRESSHLLIRSSLFFLLQKHRGLFFKPFQLHLELADLMVKFRRHLFILFVTFPATIGKYMGNFIQKPLTPLMNLIGMNTIVARKLSHRLFPFQGFQGHHGFECCVMAPSHVSAHVVSPFLLLQAIMHLIALSSFWGEL
jgi:hypothetical protein